MAQSCATTPVIATAREQTMEPPRIPLSSLPELDTLIGAFGSLTNPAQLKGGEDALVVVMVFVYDLLHML
jgi:hypothetical protein